MWTLTTTVNYVDDEKVFTETWAIAQDVAEAIHATMVREPTATSFVFTVCAEQPET